MNLIVCEGSKMLFTSSSPNKFFFLFIFLTHGAITIAQLVNIGSIVDVNSRIGKEEKIAMEIAVQDFNNGSSNKYKMVLNVSDSGGDPLQAFRAVNDLMEDQKVQAIIGMETWQETVLVATIASQAQVPVLSFATPAITPPLMSLRWPFLLRMANNDSLQMQCVASIISSYGWRKVIAIYEDNLHSADSLILPLLSDSLREVGTDIEYWSLFPPISTLTNPENIIIEELKNLLSKQSRVFIIVRSSLDLVTRLFPQAKQLGLMERGSVWITVDSVTSLFHAVNSSAMQSMKGVIGIKTHFKETSPDFRRFSTKFQTTFHATHPEEERLEPGIHVVRAYDAISTITKAVENSTYNSTSATLLQNLLANSFNGLSGEIRFNEGELCSPSVYQIVNVIGKSYAELKFWSPEFGFYDDEVSRKVDGNGATNVLGSRVYWPGELERTPEGLVIAKQLRIAVPRRAAFERFVKVENGEFTGFCIDVFKEAVGKLNYHLPYKFEALNGTYDELVHQVYLKKFDALVGDITILSSRSNFVDFTQAYAESGLSMVVPTKQDEEAWLFVKPFTTPMWVVTAFVFVYTMFVVWVLEHRSNPEFRGPWNNQLGTVLWFTFSTLFFAHRERISSNYTRVVIVMWLLVVFVVTSSYTASLTSLLTVQRLEPTVTDVQALIRANSAVGCGFNSFIRGYLENVLGFRPENLVTIISEYEYAEALKNGTIKAAFLELPYARDLRTIYCKDYRDIGPIDRFGGLGFVFPKGSYIAQDISEAFLKLSEQGTITQLDKCWFPSKCSDSENNIRNDSLSLHNFWALILVTVISSTVMLLLYLIQLFKKHSHPSNSCSESLWNLVSSVVVSSLSKDRHKNPVQEEALNRVNEEEILLNTESLSACGSPLQPEASTIVKTEMPEINIRHLGSRPRFLRLASAPCGARRVRSFDIDGHEWNQFHS